MEVESGRVGGDAAPNQTIYVRNLCENVKKEELRRSLYECFSPYGRVLDVVALKTMKMRGQAFVAFEDVASAANAMRNTQGLLFYDRPMGVQFAREKCERIARKGGVKANASREKRKREPSSSTLPPEKEPTEAKDGEERAEDSAKDTVMTEGDEEAVQNRILFVQNLPDEVDSEALTDLFREFGGFSEVRMPAGRKGIAFIEFENEEGSEIALTGMQGFRIGSGSGMKLSYAKQ